MSGSTDLDASLSVCSPQTVVPERNGHFGVTIATKYQDTLDGSTM